MLKCCHDEQWLAFRGGFAEKKCTIRKKKHHLRGGAGSGELFVEREHGGIVKEEGGLFNDCDGRRVYDARGVVHHLGIVGRMSRDSPILEASVVHTRIIVELSFGVVEVRCGVRCEVGFIGKKMWTYSYIPRIVGDLSKLTELRVKKVEHHVKGRYVSEYPGIAGVYDEWVHNRK